MALTADEVHAALDELLAEVCRRHGRSARTPSSRRLTVSGFHLQVELYPVVTGKEEPRG